MIKTVKLMLLGLILAAGFTGFAAQPVYAAKADCTNTKTFLGVPAWYRYLEVKYDDAAGDCKIVTDSANGNIVLLIMLAVVSMLMGLAAIVAVVFVVYGGVLLTISQGDPGKIASARKTILNAVIGLVIALLSSQIVQYVAKWLSS